ncbi:MAG: metallophosphoesterase [Balneolales bacterium]|nr:metallophosphoesterase [Balneolales bacterium]
MADIRYDIIGDIHGHVLELRQLLQTLGYREAGEGYIHPEKKRKPLFVGDYIDRGSESVEVLDLVMGMEQAGEAVALMGNHEFNALCYHTPGEAGEPLRPHTAKNTKQHEATLAGLARHNTSFSKYRDWLLSLPLFLEEDGFRAVHACWDETRIAFLRDRMPAARLSDSLLTEAAARGSELYDAVEVVLKGREIDLPEGLFFYDKDGHIRYNMRIRWWENPEGATYNDLRVKPDCDCGDAPVALDLLPDRWHYGSAEKPVFFGHYWLQGDPALFRDNVCCLDYSIGKGETLAAYTWDGKPRLNSENFTAIRHRMHGWGAIRSV